MADPTQPVPEPAPRAIRVLVLAAYPAVRAGLGALLAQDPALRPVEPTPAAGRPARVVAGRSAVTVAIGPPAGSDGQEPDVVVADLPALPDQSADEIADAYPGVPLVLLGADPAADGPGITAGPVAYLAPDADAPTLSAAVRGVLAGLTVLDPALAAAAGFHTHGRPAPAADSAPGEALSPREREVLRLVADGYPNKAIARELGISEHTAKFHVGSLLAKLGAASRTEAVTIATRRGLLTI